MKELLIIVSATSGQQRNVVTELQAVLKEYKTTYQLEKIKTPMDVSKMLKKFPVARTVAVYGGDGTIATAIKYLAGDSRELLILPGGTANTIAADLELPSDAVGVLTKYLQNQGVIHKYGVAKVGKKKFVLDMHTGFWTDAISETPRRLKQKIGPLAYGVSAIRKLPKAEKFDVQMVLGGSKRVNSNTYLLLVANQGFQNIFNVRLFPFENRPGVVQVALLKSLNPWRLTLWLLGRIFTKRNLGGAIKTYRAHRVEIVKSPGSFIFDDLESNFKIPLTISAGAYQTNVVIFPSLKTGASAVSRLLTYLKVFGLRLLERFRRLIYGHPVAEGAYIAPGIYVGGAYRLKAYSLMQQWGVTGIVNMRKSLPDTAPKGFEILHLQTRDWTAPSFELLSKGVNFIQKHRSKSNGVYIHCRQGEGRGPTMAAAYLIYAGMSTNEALAELKKARPVAHPNRWQVQRLREWEQSCRLKDI